MTVLEANDRIGGRIKSEKIDNTVMDLGASWIHGIGPGAADLSEWEGKLNPLWEFV